MTTPSNPEETPDPSAVPERHETSDGTVYWGDISEDKFQRAIEKFPVLAFVVEEYFGSPERQTRDVEFLSRYEAIGEETAEFDGFLNDLNEAIKQYNLATTLVTGLMGVTLSASEVRTQLTSLKDQILHEGDFAPEDEKDDDPFLINSAPERLQASFLWKREIPIGPLKGKEYPVIYYLLAAIAVVLVGLLISYIPFVGGLGVILMFVGGIAAFVVAVGILSMRSEYMHPDEAEEREAKKREVQEKKARKKGNGLFSRLNPFRN